MTTIKFECDVTDEQVEDGTADPLVAALRTLGEAAHGAGWPVRLTVDGEAISS